RRFEQAEDCYRQALDLKLEFGDRHSAASTYHQLGMVAQDQRRFEQAEDCYRQALDLSLEFGDRHSTASTYHQLGTVAQAQRRFEQAEDYLRQALQAYRDSDDERAASQVTTTLGRVLADTGRYAEAFSILVEATIGWWRLTGEFESEDIRSLTEQRTHLDQHTIDGVIDALDPTTATALRHRLDQHDQT
ncbi:tetratricopeptide repeat protein, partial [Nocardia jiangsuensis]